MSIIFILFVALTAAASLTKDAAAATALKLETQAMKGDWDKIFERGTIRVVLPYSRSLFFNDRGTQMGLDAESLREFDGWLKKKYRTRARPITVVGMPTTRDQLLANLRNGHAEIAIGNLTITAERQKNFDFTLPVSDNVSEIVVMKKGDPALANLDE
ncbi:MAG TPA: transporter substrate-binding domain-containing protein, partial [Candidatus Binatia bacterium]|nr:transporter substrate-binding domain-containing protein [Candidatus Binatia bacterium]